MPKLIRDIRTDAIAIDAAIDRSHYIDSQLAEIRLSGKDADGAAHSVVVRATIDLSGENATAADSVDLTGKNVQQTERAAAHPWSRR